MKLWLTYEMSNQTATNKLDLTLFISLVISAFAVPGSLEVD